MCVCIHLREPGCHRITNLLTPCLTVIDAKEAVVRTSLSALQTLLYCAIMHKTLPGVCVCVCVCVFVCVCACACACGI